jgi:hypothetical protein
MNISGKPIISAFSLPAWRISLQTFLVVACLSRKTGIAWTAASLRSFFLDSAGVDAIQKMRRSEKGFVVR